MSYRIDKDIPVPVKKGNNEKYPWRDMKVGESFSFPPDRYEKVCYAAAQAHARGLGRFRVSKLQSRVWRIE